MPYLPCRLRLMLLQARATVSDWYEGVDGDLLHKDPSDVGCTSDCLVPSSLSPYRIDKVDGISRRLHADGFGDNGTVA